MTTGIRLHTLQGESLEAYIADLARLRITVFKDFPYLYDGDLDYEQQYLQTYIDCPDAAIIIAKDGDQVVGAASCLPMRDEDTAFQHAFLDTPHNAETIDVDSLFYCAESVLDKRYRGQGIGVQFFHYREAHAARLGGFTHACFCAVDRPQDHPLRPADYTPLDHFWQKRGYQKQADRQAQFAWKDIDQAVSTTKTLTFWLKTLCTP